MLASCSFAAIFFIRFALTFFFDEDTHGPAAAAVSVLDG